MAKDDNINGIAYFGDSLTDGGDLFDFMTAVLEVPVPPESAGYAGVFSNGAVYGEVATELLDKDYVNYGVGGARAVGTRTVQEFITANGQDGQVRADADPADLAIDTNIGAQVDRFIASLDGEPAESGTAASILIGINDYANIDIEPVATFEARVTALIEAVVGTILFESQKLIAAGVDKIILNQLWEELVFPAIAGGDAFTQDYFNTVVTAQNAALDTIKVALEAQGAEVEIIEFNALTEEILADQTAFGFIAPATVFRIIGSGGDPAVETDEDGNVSVSFETNPLSAPFDDDQLMFWDVVHPTAAFHGVVGAFQAASLRARVEFRTEEADTFRVGRGEQVIFAKDGDDTFGLGKGDDTGFGGLGNDKIFSGRGADISNGGSGNDYVFGGRGADVVAGAAGDDFVFGGRGEDVLLDGLGSDFAYGGNGNDIFIHIDPTLIGGEAGVDTDHIRGGSGKDTLVLVLGEDALAAYEDGGLSAIGVNTRRIEKVVVLEDRSDLADLDVAARLEEADLWGII